MFYAIFNELFSSNSPQAIYGAAFDKCKDDTRVQDALGQPIKCFGEESRRRRRTHIAHQIYQKNNRNYMRLSFHIQGIRNKATVHCEMRMVRNCDQWRRNVVFLTKLMIFLEWFRKIRVPLPLRSTGFISAYNDHHWRQ